MENLRLTVAEQLSTKFEILRRADRENLQLPRLPSSRIPLLHLFFAIIFALSSAGHFLHEITRGPLLPTDPSAFERQGASLHKAAERGSGHSERFAERARRLILLTSGTEPSYLQASTEIHQNPLLGKFIPGLNADQADGTELGLFFSLQGADLDKGGQREKLRNPRPTPWEENHGLFGSSPEAGSVCGGTYLELLLQDVVSLKPN